MTHTRLKNKKNVEFNSIFTHLHKHMLLVFCCWTATSFTVAGENWVSLALWQMFPQQHSCGYEPLICPANSRLGSYIKGLLTRISQRQRKEHGCCSHVRLLLSTLFGYESWLTEHTWKACYMGEHTMIYWRKQKPSTPWCQDGNSYSLCDVFHFTFITYTCNIDAWSDIWWLYLKRRM